MEISPKKVSNKQPQSNTGELSAIYYFYVIYECILINIIGFVTLFFQCELQNIEDSVETKYGPQFNITQWEWDSLFGHYWLKHDLNCNTRYPIIYANFSLPQFSLLISVTIDLHFK